jgi:hypothetical protein
MSTNNETQQEVVTGVLSDLYAEQLRLKSAYQIAEYNLYYSQGANIIAAGKLDAAIEKRKFAATLNQQGVVNDNIATNLLAAATQAETNVALSVTNAATAASNVQIASKAISQLAADIGAAFNFVIADDIGTEIYRMTGKANELIRETSNDAVQISRCAMDASASMAEIIAAPILSETETAMQDVENLLTATLSEFSTLSDMVKSDSLKVDLTSKAEKVAEGLLTDAAAEYSAVREIYAVSNLTLNYNLQATLCHCEIGTPEISISFNPYVNAFSNLEHDGVNENNFTIPDPDATYYALIARADQAQSLNTAKVELLFTEFPDRFQEIQPGDVVNDLTLKCDYDNQLISVGKSYVVFLYTVLDLNYKKFTNNFDDILSAPSDPFTPAIRLLPAEQIKLQAKSDKTSELKYSSLTFTVKGGIVPDAEYRCMFLPVDTPGINKFMTESPDVSVASLDDEFHGSEKVNEDGDEAGNSGNSAKNGFFFNEYIAELISPANYIVATLDVANTEKSPEAHQYRVELGLDITDNFGLVVETGKQYLPVILSTIKPDSLNRDAFIGSHSTLIKPVVQLKSRGDVIVVL